MADDVHVPWDIYVQFISQSAFCGPTACHPLGTYNQWIIATCVNWFADTHTPAFSTYSSESLLESPDSGEEACGIYTNEVVVVGGHG